MVWVACAASSAPAVRTPLSVGISTVLSTEDAWLAADVGEAAPVTARVVKTPPATPERISVFREERRGFRWLRM
ncbi:hypothetical protein GCM10023347_09420 [Streptomyces chumphonensis]